MQTAQICVWVTACSTSSRVGILNSCSYKSFVYGIGNACVYCIVACQRIESIRLDMVYGDYVGEILQGLGERVASRRLCSCSCPTVTHHVYSVVCLCLVTLVSFRPLNKKPQNRCRPVALPLWGVSIRHCANSQPVCHTPSHPAFDQVGIIYSPLCSVYMVGTVNRAILSVGASPFMSCS